MVPPLRLPPVHRRTGMDGNSSPRTARGDVCLGVDGSARRAHTPLRQPAVFLGGPRHRLWGRECAHHCFASAPPPVVNPGAQYPRRDIAGRLGQGLLAWRRRSGEQQLRRARRAFRSLSAAGRRSSVSPQRIEPWRGPHRPAGSPGGAARLGATHRASRRLTALIGSTAADLEPATKDRCVFGTGAMPREVAGVHMESNCRRRQCSSCARTPSR